jgi:long-chain acyl-CoA synthetase
MNIFDFLFEHTSSLRKNLVLGPAEQISYRDTYDDCLFLAAYLQRTIGKNNRVLMVGSNSIFFIKAYLAILKSGNICVPIDPDIQKDDYALILSRCNPHLIFISRRYLYFMEGFSGIIIDELMMDSIILQRLDLNELFNSTVNMGDAAEVIFTSGAAGKPKGVVLSHENVIANTSSILTFLGLKEQDIMQVVMPFHHCYGLSLLQTHIRVGAALVLTNSFMFLRTVISDLKRYRCTGFAGVPYHFQLLLRKTSDFKNTGFPDLRYVTQAGDKLHNSLIKEFTEAFPNVKFYVMYGLTEATALLSYLPPELIHEKLGSIGKGMPGVELDVINKLGKQIGEAETGEIIARGANIMLSYLDDEEATMEVIRNSWLYTGDLAEMDKEGYIFITGRKKEIIKLGGKRFSPKEIEEVILQIPFVIDCSVKGMNGDDRDESVFATLLVTNTELVTEEAVKDYCSDKLAPYKIPTVFVINEDS